MALFAIASISNLRKSLVGPPASMPSSDKPVKLSLKLMSVSALVLNDFQWPNGTIQYILTVDIKVRYRINITFLPQLDEMLFQTFLITYTKTKQCARLTTAIIIY